MVGALAKGLVVAYHGTPYAFERFDASIPGGIHFGTLSQASHALSLKVARLPLAQFEQLPLLDGGQPGYLIRAVLTIRNPKRVSDVRTAERWDEEIAVARVQGYDGLVYRNAFEGRDEADSWVVFSPDQIIRIGGNAMATDLDLLAEAVQAQLAAIDWAAATSPIAGGVPLLPDAVYDDLAALAKEDFARAAGLWDSLVPAGHGRPATLDPVFREQIEGAKAVAAMANAPAEVARFHIPEENLPELRNIVARINKRAAKLGFPETTIKEVQTYAKSATITDLNGLPFKVMTTYHVVDMEGAKPVLAGWRFLGKLEHLDMNGTNVVKGAVPKEYRDCPPNCEHCNKLRRRSETFVLQNAESGQLMQVGRSCLTDFFNNEDPLRHASFLEMMLAASEEIRELEEYEFTGASARAYNAQDVLHTAILVMAEDGGWVSAEKAEEIGRQPTSLTIKLVLRGAEKAPKCTAEESLRANEKAEAILAWLTSEEAEEQAADNPYMHNLVAIARVGEMKAKNAGLFGSAAVAYDRHLQRKASAELAGKSMFVGQVDAKLDSHLVRIVGKVLIPGGQYGDKMLYRFRDDEGNLLVWFCSGSDIGNVGDRMHINGTITKHEVYRDEKQTTLSRVTSNEEKLCEAVERSRSLATIKKLLKSPVNLDHCDYKSKMSPLMHAAVSGNVDAMRVLLDAGADPDRSHPPETNSPLLLAALHGYAECVDMLLDYGADPATTDRVGNDLERIKDDAQKWMQRDAFACGQQYAVEAGRGDATMAHWAKTQAYYLTTIEPVHGDWGEWFTMESAKAEEAGKSYDFARQADYSSCQAAPIVVFERDGKAYAWRGEAQIGAALRDGKKTLPALVGVYDEELVVKYIHEQRQIVSDILESQGERLSQYRSEVALYGDAGPGQHPSVWKAESDRHLEEHRAKLAELLATPQGKALLAREATERAEWESNNCPF